ncbi:hypothetical protein GF345_04970 [Candidatus Woesearchaeota archaeon]|nr:hypothetical protein [Candidatus Woesearchaeota archaeon]
MKLNILNTREKKAILKSIKEQWDADLKTDLVFLLSSKFKLYLMNKDFSTLDETKLHIDKMGMYFGEVMKNKEVRLSIEGSQIVGPVAKKNVLDISDGETKIWLHGHNLFRKVIKESGFVIIKNNDDFMGCGKVKQGEILNYVPKTRRILGE